MSKGLKVALILITSAILLCGAVTGGIVLWFRANADSLKADGDKAKAEGEAFGRANDADACVTEGLRRIATAGFVAQAVNNIFVEHCLEVAQRRSDFCSDVPKKEDILSSATWAADQCAARNYEGDQPCARMMQAVQRACHGK